MVGWVLHNVLLLDHAARSLQVQMCLYSAVLIVRICATAHDQLRKHDARSHGLTSLTMCPKKCVATCTAAENSISCCCSEDPFYFIPVCTLATPVRLLKLAELSY